MTTFHTAIPPLALLAATLAAACSANLEPPRGGSDRSRRSELGVFMKTQMNPPFSRLSFLLFHASPDHDIDPRALPQTANELARASARLASWIDPPGESEQGKLVFFDYAESLKADIVNLQTEIGANRKDGAIKVFESLRKKCDSCHHFFRYDQSGSQDDGVRSADSR